MIVECCLFHCCKPSDPFGGKGPGAHWIRCIRCPMPMSCARGECSIAVGEGICCLAHKMLPDGYVFGTTFTFQKKCPHD